MRVRTGCGRPNTDHRCSSCRRVVGSKQEGLKSVARYRSQGNITHVAHKEIANLLVTGEGDGFPLLLLRQLLFDDDAAKVLGLRFSALVLHCGRTKCSTSLPRIWCTSCVPSARSSSIAPIWMRTGIDFAPGTGLPPAWCQSGSSELHLRIVANTRALGQVVGDNAEAAYHAGNVPGYRSAACRG